MSKYIAFNIDNFLTRKDQEIDALLLKAIKLKNLPVVLVSTLANANDWNMVQNAYTVRLMASTYSLNIVPQDFIISPMSVNPNSFKVLKLEEALGTLNITKDQLLYVDVDPGRIIRAQKNGFHAIGPHDDEVLKNEIDLYLNCNNPTTFVPLSGAASSSSGESTARPIEKHALVSTNLQKPAHNNSVNSPKISLPQSKAVSSAGKRETIAARLITEKVDIFELPMIDPEYSGKSGFEVTIGDLHANTIKLLFLLVKHGIAKNLTTDDYAQLVAIYSKPCAQLTADDLSLFDTLLNKIEFTQDTKVRLIGDDLADRGSNDYFTLKLFEKMNKHGVPLEILISNHGVEFIEASEKKQNHFHAPMLDSTYPFYHAISMENLQSLTERGLVSRDDVLNIANKAYKPALKAISYTLNGNGIAICSHAAIGLNTIWELAVKLGIEYKDNTVVNLAQTIDKINEKFQEHVQENTVHSLYTREMMWEGYNSATVDLSGSPFEMLMWNRRYDKLDRPAQINSYTLTFVHGHDSKESTQQNIINLDNLLGKEDHRSKRNNAEYTALYSKEVSSSIELQNELGLFIENFENDSSTDSASLKAALSSAPGKPDSIPTPSLTAPHSRFFPTVPFVPKKLGELFTYTLGL